MQMKPVANSSSIAAWGYDPETETLQIKFTSGSVYQHAGVPAKVADGFNSAESAGRYYAGAIRREYQGTKIDPATAANQDDGVGGE